tara:strand:- start:950 stop:2245 length:1296 start_codon:yes stop_codon:yes gene_type:complete
MTNGIQQLADNLAEFGRYGDTYMVHAAEGETVVPAEILEANPNLKDELFRQMQLMGIQDPNRYVVGNTLNSINPITGQPEFFFKKLFKKVVKVAKVAAPIVVGAFNPAAGAALGAGIAAAEGKGIGGILAGGASGYFGGKALSGGISGFQGAGDVGFFTKLGSGIKGGIGNLFTAPQGGTRLESFGQLFGRQAPALGSADLRAALPPDIAGRAAQKTTALGKESFRRAIGEGFTSAGREAAAKTGAEQALEKVVSPAKAASGKGRGLGKVTDFLGSEAGKNILGTLLPLGAGALAAKYQSDFNKQRTDVNPQMTAGQEYFSTPRDQRTAEQQFAAGISAPFGAAELARQTGISVEDAQNYLSSAFPSERVMAAMGGEIVGPGTGTSDSIPARLSDGEFVLTAQAVRGAGNGDRDLGAARMYDLMSRFERMA